MIYFIGLLFVTLMFVYYTKHKFKDCQPDEANLMKDIPTISVNTEDLEIHAAEIANHYSSIRKTSCRKKVIKSLDKSYYKIIKGYNYIDEEVRNNREVAPASDWLLDNLYLIEKEYKHIKHNMPRDYYKNLPVIDRGIMKGYPRIYHISTELVSHSEGKLDEKSIETFVNSYQNISVLTSGELWALPIMLRIALIQKIHKITESILYSSQEKIKADNIADKLIQAVEDNSLDKLIEEDLTKGTIEFTINFTERLLKVLRESGVDSEKIYQWINENLQLRQISIENIINIEHKRQATEQTSMGNTISTIREVEEMDWKQIFDKLSNVERTLNEDPIGIYSKMDFDSRDYYRHRIEKLSLIMNKPESYIAKKAVQCAQEAYNIEGEDYRKHVGYYIVDEGLKTLKNKCGYKEKMSESFKNNIKKHPVLYYLSTILLGTLILISIFLFISYINDSERTLWRYIIATLVLVVPCSEIIISFLAWNLMNLTNPKFIPKIDYKGSVGEENRTIVVIPTIINSDKKAQEIIENIEVFYLANCDENIYFALLGDFVDSSQKEQEEDRVINEASLRAIEELNEKYCSNSEDLFYFFNRARKYNEKEHIWMGWERKRGKLMEFNLLMRGNKNTSYNVISGDISEIAKAKYIITLDVDTQLPRDSAKKLIGAMSHLLNEPHIDNKAQKVIRGYGVMQPKVGVSIISANKTMFSRIFSGDIGIETYTTSVSDIYQDIFNEGIFMGKGIYNIDVFNEMLQDEIPENSILSHDLLEGIYTRAALVTDIELIDSYPSYYNSSIKRLHRWVRGDWQLLPWIKSKSLNSLSKWKIIDNLRRSLLYPTIIVLISFSFNILPDGTDKWIVAGFMSLIIPILFNVTENVALPISGISISGKINTGKKIVEQVFLVFCFLPYAAYYMVDAIIRTLFRLYFKKENLLEWQTASDVEAKSGKTLKDYVKFMWIGSIISIVILLLAYQKSAESGALMVPICIIWFISPWIAWHISKDEETKIILTIEQRKLLKRLSRKTWAYFEDFVDEQNNWLAPDNYQENPPNGIAYRTSPTNISMGLTSNIVAYDLGYISLMENINRLDCIFSSIESLEFYNGHLYNWYNTLTKEPLYPRYVSTVDSGNLAGYLWTIEAGLKETLNDSLLNKKIKDGLMDTLLLANEEIYETMQIKGFYDEDINTIYNNTNLDIISLREMLLNLWNKVSQITNKCTQVERKQLYWNKKVQVTAEKTQFEINKIFPWIDYVVQNKERNKELYDSLNDMAFSIPIQDIHRKITEIAGKSDLNLKELLDDTKKEVAKLLESIHVLIKKSNKLVADMNFTMLYDERRGLFSIGYDLEKDSLGKSYYDLLASEARQASFIAIAKGDVDTEHWFKLGRSMTVLGNSKALVSWSGTMFEYLMPFLIMKSYPNTLLQQTYIAVVNGQKKYGKINNIPWGISESAYKNFDKNLNYQYKAFGVPGIGLKRGLKNELVVSPYSTIMALQVDLESAFSNINMLKKQGLEGKYGFYEAVDFTRERLLKEEKSSIIKCFMVHHEGMSLMSLDNVLNDNILRKRFHDIPRVKATELLLQEKASNRLVYDRTHKYEPSESQTEKPTILIRKFNTAKTSLPETQLLSNGSYSLMISNSGSGYSKKEDMNIYRWKEDITTDNSGSYIYIKNVTDNKYWSSSYEPCKSEGKSYEVLFYPDKVEFKREDDDIFTRTEISVSNEEDAEVRKISITNNGSTPKILEITSYCEVTLSELNADIVHPAFNNLFISTEFNVDPECIIASRRPRAKGQKKPYLVQCIAFSGNAISSVQYETSRINFIGRNKNIINPCVMEEDTPLKNTVGAVLDPIISLRKRIRIESGETSIIAYTTAVTESRENAISIANKYKEMNRVDRLFEIAYSQNIVEMKYLGIKSAQANLYQSMASRILFLSNLYQDREEYIKKVSKNQKDLWKHGISGDIPIVLVIIKEEIQIDMVTQMLKAHSYWTLKGLKVDLVILNLEDTQYTQNLQDTIRDIIATSKYTEKINRPSGVFLHSKTTIDKEDINLLMAISRIVIDGEKGIIGSQIKKENKNVEIELLQKNNKVRSYTPHKFKINNLEFFNEIGGFDLENDQYVISLKDRRTTPAPWVNIVANENFGFMVSESGSSYTWFKNSRENKITTWSNDWVSDPVSEAIYLRDEESGDLWSVTPDPIRDKGEYVIEHGFGYSNFKHEAYGIIGEVTMFVPRGDNAKICRVRLKNNTEDHRVLSLTYYAQLVLGVVPQHTSIHVVTQLNEEKKYISAQNPYSENFGKLHAYLKIFGGTEESFTGNRTDFIGRGGSVKSPKALEKIKLSNISGAGMDPCLVENSKFCIESGQEKTILVLLGEGEDLEEVENTISKYEDMDKAEVELDLVKSYWEELLHRIRVKTPDKSMDIMLNGWLLYQTIACRIWARSAFYQSGGAYGFRDQLQDVMAVGFVDTDMMKDHILYSASRQFTEGDVQHWWHPIVDSGIRTRFSDDLLWMPYVTIDYVKRTGDFSILDERVAYLEDKPLDEGEDERYTISRKSDKVETLYEHCIKAIDRGLKFGPHNIPLMGSGDWNDGMSEVGNKGIGESVWLGWFLYSILDNFEEICKAKNDISRLQRYSEMKDFIKLNLNLNAWDGNWYRRAYFDDGSPLGSIENDECQIDSLAQSWAVISKGGDKDKVKKAMNALEKYLVKEDKGMVLLLTPPFENSSQEPGYIKGYVPGVRENGGQYTHASTWVVLAMAKLGQGNKAWRVYNMLNPINHTKSYYDCERYKVEPYVITADVYGREPHIGRGGWSWYTGAAGWMYRVAIEGILGLEFEGTMGFTVNPNIPDEWNEFEIEYTRGKCKYEIMVKRGEKEMILLNGSILNDKIIPYLQEGVQKVDIVIK
ncbi:cyclic beta 1-2 glucan synthetase [Alkalibaculum sp. M08DMB]|uniref:Cyclic beta 1-2 glucan synthetase n=1 Tax=Alkalibaculum sporogenes TaxID=2655001 RepID=A0A6A7KBM0_9FIRM|nr:glucoamylase family protein [Alkalibaculum sporogenes]MPW26752.1 cyclic beta 1-2 glucan synthetase [Alkalibaculum sporogenes]